MSELSLCDFMFNFRRFVEVMTEYNRIQVEYREASKNKIARQLEIAGKQATDEGSYRVSPHADFGFFIT